MSEILSFVKRLAGERDQIATVAARWRTQYPRGSKIYKTESTDAMHEQLLALPVDATAKDVAAIIRNDGWIGYRCNGCHTIALRAFQIGEEPDCASNVVLCETCALALARFILADLHTEPGDA